MRPPARWACRPLLWIIDTSLSHLVRLTRDSGNVLVILGLSIELFVLKIYRQARGRLWTDRQTMRNTVSYRDRAA